MIWRRMAATWLAGRLQATDDLSSTTSRPVTHNETTPAAEDSATVQRPVGVVFALAIEAGGLVDRLSGVVRTHTATATLVEGALAGRAVTIVVSGPGAKAAGNATQTLLDAASPAWVISAGFTGGLRPELARGELFLAEGLVDEAGQRMSLELMSRAGMTGPVQVHTGRLLSAHRLIRLPDEKRRLAAEFDAAAVDMESFAVAEVCQRRGVPLVVARVVSDAVDDELSPVVERLLQQKTVMARLGAAAAALTRRPGTLKELWRLKEQAWADSDRLAALLVQLIAPRSSDGE